MQLQCRLGCRDDIEQIYRNPSFSFLNKCLYPWMMLRINPYGDVIPCTGSTASMGNVREEPFLAIWNGQRYREFRRELKKQGLLADCLKCNTLAERRFGVWNFLPRVFN